MLITHAERRLCRSAFEAFCLSVSLSVCLFVHSINYKRNDPKVFKLSIRNDLGMSYRSSAVIGSLEALPCLEAVSRQYFHCLMILVLRVTVLVLVSVLTLIVSVLVLPLLFWSCASRPRQFKTPVEKCQRLTRNPAGKVLDNDQS